jgi:hypothetical protein
MIVIYRLSTGAMVQDNLAALPKDFDANTFGWREQPARYPADLIWAASVANFVDVETAASVEAALIARLKADGEQRRMMVLTPGGGKKMVYNAKLSEVEAFRGLFTTVVGGTLTAVLAAVAGLPAKDRTRKFRYALAEQALRKESSISPAIGRFEAGADAANAEAARIEAVEQVGTAAIKAATTAAGKRAAYAAINWDWKP